MSVIAVKGVPHKWSYGNLVRCVSQASQEEYNEFEMLNFEGAKGSKTAYVRVSEKLDPVRVVEKFNSAGNTQLEAFIPDHVPDEDKGAYDLPKLKWQSLPMDIGKKKLPPKKNLKRKFEPEKSPAHILPLTHRELLIEMQAKYSGLYNLSKKTGHKLLRQLSVSLFDRLKKLISSMGKEVATDCITLSKTYRRIYPHFGDFQFILSTLHSLQDASGAPRAQISETALMAVRHHPYLFENVTHSTVKVACKHFSDVVAKTMTEHINNLDSKVNATDSEEDVARKKVRTELKKLAPFLPLMVEQVSTKHFIPMKPRYHRISGSSEESVDGIPEVQSVPREPQLSRKRRKLLKKKEKRKLQRANARKVLTTSADVNETLVGNNLTEQQRTITKQSMPNSYHEEQVDNFNYTDKRHSNMAVEAPFEFKKLPAFESSQKRKENIKELVTGFFTKQKLGTGQHHSNRKWVDSEIARCKIPQWQDLSFPKFATGTKKADSNELNNLVRSKKRKLAESNVDDIETSPAKRARLIYLDPIDFQKPITNPKKRRLAQCNVGVKEIPSTRPIFPESNVDLSSMNKYKHNPFSDKFKITDPYNLTLVKSNVVKEAIPIAVNAGHVAPETNMDLLKQNIVKFNTVDEKNTVCDKFEIIHPYNLKLTDSVDKAGIPIAKIARSVLPELPVEFKKRKSNPLSLIDNNIICDKLKIAGSHNKPEFNIEGPKRELSRIEVAVTSIGGHISEATSAAIKEALTSVLVNFARAMDHDTKAPVFIGRPTYKDGSLRLRCIGKHTIDWLKWALKYINIPEVHSLVVKELPRMVRCGIVTHTLTNDKDLVLKKFQMGNSWAEVWRWEIHTIIQQGKKCFIVLSIPEDLISIILNHNRRFSYGLGTVYLKFLNAKGKYTDVPPEIANESVIMKTAKTVNDIHKYMGVTM